MTERNKTVPTHELLRALDREVRAGRQDQWRLCGADYVRGLERAITIVRELAAIQTKPRKEKT